MRGWRFGWFGAGSYGIRQAHGILEAGGGLFAWERCRSQDITSRAALEALGWWLAVNLSTLYACTA